MNDSTQSRPSALSEFWDFAKDFKSVTAWVAKAAVAAPLTDILLNIGPPWPSRVGVAILVCIVEVLVLMYSFEFWRRKQQPIRRVQRVMQFGILTVAVSFLLYIWLFASYVEDAPDSWHRVVIGVTFHEEIAQLVRSDRARYTSQELLELFDRKPMHIWTESSVNLMRVLILATWLAFWAALSAVISSFIALQWRRRPSP